MKVYVDADACPVVDIIVDVCRAHMIPVVLLCDTNHILSSDYAEVRTVSPGADAVDFALVNLLHRGDAVVTQDYGVAALALGKGCKALHQSGMRYTDDNIDLLLFERHEAKKARMAHGKHHYQTHPKRTPEDDANFRAAFAAMIED